MSKTAQRKRSLYDQGFEHGRTGHYFVWKRHRFMSQYRRGYKECVKFAKSVKRYPFWRTIAFILGWRESI